MHRKILIMGMSASGKTTLADKVAPLVNAVGFNADEVREHLNRDLVFSSKTRSSMPARAVGPTQLFSEEIQDQSEAPEE